MPVWLAVHMRSWQREVTLTEEQKVVGSSQGGLIVRTGAGSAVSKTHF